MIRTRVAAGLTAVLLAAAGCSGSAANSIADALGESPSPLPKAAAPGAEWAPPIPPKTALTLLARIAVKGRAPMTGYTREKFGPAWEDVDHNGCDTRDDVLNHDLTAKRWRSGTHDCVVVAGALADPYTGHELTFSKAQADAVQIDHMVALGDAWQTGAFRWTAAKRAQLANDPLNLQAVDGPTNEGKGDADAATWLPPNKAYRCTYVTRQVQVKARYGLWVTPAEHNVLKQLLTACASGRF